MLSTDVTNSREKVIRVVRVAVVEPIMASGGVIWTTTVCGRVARGSKFLNPSRPTKAVTRPDPTKPAGLSITGKVAKLITS